jgi:hypothetical protein
VYIHNFMIMNDFLLYLQLLERQGEVQLDGDRDRENYLKVAGEVKRDTVAGEVQLREKTKGIIGRKQRTKKDYRWMRVENKKAWKRYNWIVIVRFTGTNA